MFLETAVLDELIHTVDRKTANHISTKIWGGRHPNSMGTNNLFPSELKCGGEEEGGEEHMKAAKIWCTHYLFSENLHKQLP